MVSYILKNYHSVHSTQIALDLIQDLKIVRVYGTGNGTQNLAKKTIIFLHIMVFYHF